MYLTTSGNIPLLQYVATSFIDNVLLLSPPYANINKMGVKILIRWVINNNKTGDKYASNILNLLQISKLTCS